MIQGWFSRRLFVRHIHLNLHLTSTTAAPSDLMTSQTMLIWRGFSGISSSVRVGTKLLSVQVPFHWFSTMIEIASLQNLGYRYFWQRTSFIEDFCKNSVEGLQEQTWGWWIRNTLRHCYGLGQVFSLTMYLTGPFWSINNHNLWVAHNVFL
jgi:hypothetical protein